MLYAVAVFAPLFGSAIAGLFGKVIGDRAAQAVTIICMLLASACGITSFVELVYQGAPSGVVSLGTWVEAGQFHASLGAALRHAVGRHGGDGHHGGDADPHLQRRLHGA